MTFFESPFASLILTVGGLLFSAVGAAGIVASLFGFPRAAAPASRAWMPAVALAALLAAGIAAGYLSPAAAMPVLILTAAAIILSAVGFGRGRAIVVPTASEPAEAGDTPLRRAA